MHVSPKLFFGLENNYTYDQLKKAHDQKLNLVASMNLTNVEKQVYMEQVMCMYKKAKKELDETNTINNNHLINPFNFGSQISDSFFQPQMTQFNNMNQITNSVWSMSNTISSNNSSSNNFQSSMSQSISTSRKLNSDGSVTIDEITNIDNNGSRERTIKSYKKLPDGTIQNLIPEQSIESISENTNQTDNQLE